MKELDRFFGDLFDRKFTDCRGLLSALSQNSRFMRDKRSRGLVEALDGMVVCLEEKDAKAYVNRLSFLDEYAVKEAIKDFKDRSSSSNFLFYEDYDLGVFKAYIELLTYVLRANLFKKSEESKVEGLP